MRAAYNKQCPLTHLLDRAANSVLLFFVCGAHKAGQIYNIKSTHIEFSILNVGTVEFHLFGTISKLAAQLRRFRDYPRIAIKVMNVIGSGPDPNTAYVLGRTPFVTEAIAFNSILTRST
ncbi:MAG: hypothetical protein Q9225_002235 [Loekoesia sp. 1 TL-2023]